LPPCRIVGGFSSGMCLRSWQTSRSFHAACCQAEIRFRVLPVPRGSSSYVNQALSRPPNSSASCEGKLLTYGTGRLISAALEYYVLTTYPRFASSWRALLRSSISQQATPVFGPTAPRAVLEQSLMLTLLRHRRPLRLAKHSI